MNSIPDLTQKLDELKFFAHAVTAFRGGDALAITKANREMCDYLMRARLLSTDRDEWGVYILPTLTGERYYEKIKRVVSES